MFTSHYARAALLLIAAAILARFTLRHFETRWQIMIFWGIVLTYQLILRPAFGRAISVPSTILDIAVVTVALVGTKFVIEGHVWP